ncbi:hypothetical protein E2320_003895, partial [Naja naja]
MKLAILFLLFLPLCLAKPFYQRGLFDFMLEDEAGSGTPEPERYPFMPECPFRCQCHLRVVQCSDLGLKEVPKHLPPDTTLLDLQNNKITEIKDGDFKNLKDLHVFRAANVSRRWPFSKKELFLFPWQVYFGSCIALLISKLLDIYIKPSIEVY